MVIQGDIMEETSEILSIIEEYNIVNCFHDAQESKTIKSIQQAVTS